MGKGCEYLSSRYTEKMIMRIGVFIGALFWSSFGVAYVINAQGVEYRLAYQFAALDTTWQQAQSWPEASWNSAVSLGNFGFRRDEAWIRLSVTNTLDSEQYRIARFAYHAHDFVDVHGFSEGADRPDQIWYLGDHVLGVTRPVEEKNAAFPIRLMPGESRQYFIRVASHNALLLDLELVDESSHDFHLQQAVLLSGMVYGILLVMALYNLGLAISIKDKAYYYYVAYVLSYLLFILVLNGDGYYYFWSGYPMLNAYGLPVVGGLLIIPSLLFPYYLLNLPKHLSGFARAVRGTVVVVGLFVFVIPFLGLSVSVAIINVLSLIISLVVLGMGLYLTYLKVPVAAIYTLAWFVLLVGLAVLPMSSMGWIESNLLTRNANLIGGVAETIILSLALAQRFRTERKEKKAAMSLALASQKDAERQRHMLQDMFYSAPVGIFRMSTKGQLLAANPTLVELLGYDSEMDMIERSMEVRARFNNADALTQLVLKNRQVLDHETEVTRCDDQVINCSITLRATEMDNTDLIEGFVTDITARKQSQFIHDVMERERLNTITQLVTGVSHEMSTPLGTTITSLSLGRDLLNKTKHQFEADRLQKNEFADFLNDSLSIVDMMSDNLQRLSGLIARFKQISVTPLDIEEVDVVLLEHIKERAAQQFKLDDSVSIVCEGESATAIKTYPGVWSMIVDQLIDNSVVHGFEGKTGEKHISMTLHHMSEGCEFIFRDNGRGLSPEIGPALFDPFVTSKRGREGNAGLGLYRVYTLVQQVLKGSISVLPTEEGLALSIIFQCQPDQK